MKNNKMALILAALLLLSCAACGKTFFASGNRAKYCEECSAKRRRKSDRERKYLSRHGA